MNLKEYLAIDEILQIKENLILQGKSVSADNMIAATNYYYENDAFINFAE